MAGAVDTRNQAWADDKSRFGLKMLQKMGWSEGKGLGREENGQVNPLRAKKNFEKEGLGVSVVKNSSWDAPAQMAQGLNSVLAKLCSSNSYMVKREGGEQDNVANRTVGFYARRAAQKNVKGYSSDALREIFGGVSEGNERKGKEKHKNGEEGEKHKNGEEKDERDGLCQVEKETGKKQRLGGKRKKKYEKLGVSSKIKKPHKGDKKKRKRKKEKTR